VGEIETVRLAARATAVVGAVTAWPQYSAVVAGGSVRLRRSALPPCHPNRPCWTVRPHWARRTNRVIAWCAEQGIERAGPRREVYGHWYDDWSRVTTELVYVLT
jgi:hypothetical protein